MRFILSTVLICVLNFCLLAQTLNCQKFRNGTFKIIANGHTTIIKRLGATQWESFDGEKVPIPAVVKWIDNCTYTLKPGESGFKKYPSMPKNALFTVKIIKVTKNSYTQITTSNFTKMKFTSEVIKIK